MTTCDTQTPRQTQLTHSTHSILFDCSSLCDIHRHSPVTHTHTHTHTQTHTHTHTHITDFLLHTHTHTHTDTHTHTHYSNNYSSIYKAQQISSIETAISKHICAHSIHIGKKEKRRSLLELDESDMTPPPPPPPPTPNSSERQKYNNASVKTNN